MSTYWGYHCKTCDKNSDHWFNHGERQLEEFFIAKTIIDKHNFKWIELNTLSGRNAGDMHEFLDNHRGHDICLHSEYGDIKEFAGGGNERQYDSSRHWRDDVYTEAATGLV